MYDFEKYEKLIKETLSPYRFNHSMCVAKRAKELAVLHGENPDKAYLAGVLHDITKEMTNEEQIRLIDEDGHKLSYVEKGNHRVFHQMSGAAYVKNVLKIDDEEIINGIRYHTTGREDMSVFEMIIYLADFTSEDRSYPDVDKMRDETDRGLLNGMLYSLRHTIVTVAGENRLLHPDTLNCYNWVLYKMQQEDING